MRSTQYFLNTLKETPADAEITSHQLMLRAGLIRRLSNGLYSWLPLGLRVLRKVENIIRQEMNNSGAQELLMPVVQPAELWQTSGRWEQYGSELLRISDRHKRDYCLGPTHEEVICDLMRNELSSYKQLPVNFYQIQTKFRDEIRPRFGVMRSREFIMKDAYSFHTNSECLAATYSAMHETYSRIFSRLGLDFRAVQADTGSIGGQASHEFHVIAQAGEDAIAFSDSSDYAANIELAATLANDEEYKVGSQSLEEVATPTQKTIEELSSFLNIEPKQCLKTLLVLADTQDSDEENDASTKDENKAEKKDSNKNKAPEIIALVLRGDHQLNEIKAEKIKGIATPLTFATDAQVQQAIQCEPGFLGPINLNEGAKKIRIIADFAAAACSDFVCGANKKGMHFSGASWQRDCQFDDSADLRNIVDGDPSPDGQGNIIIRRGIEVGHIFQLGDKYSQALQATVLDENQKKTTLTMGCYGIGVTRIVASAIEQNHDDNGIIWPSAIAPFQVALVPINLHKSEEVRTYCDDLYQQLQDAGIDVLYFDHDKARLGSTLADVELIGIPHRLVIGAKGLEKSSVEYRARTDQENTMLESQEVFSTIVGKINQE